MLLAERGVGEFGVGDALGALLAAARIGLDVWKAIDSSSLAHEAQRLDKLGIEVERQIALEKLSLLKLQEELDAAQAANLTSSVSTGTYLAIGAMALAAIFLGRR